MSEVKNPEGMTHKRIYMMCMFVCAFMAAIFVILSPTKAYADIFINVGYAGGPYYQKAYFTESELWSMADSEVYEYFSKDSGGFLRKGYGQGVRLENILAAADIDPNAMFRFYIATKDNYVQDDGSVGAGAEAWRYSELCGSDRYYYSAMRDHVSFDYNHVEVNDSSALEQSAEYVPSIIALRSSFNRVSSVDDPGWDTANLGTGSGYRLMFGQKAPDQFSAHDFAEYVIGIVCIIGGEDGTDIPDIVIPDAVREALKDAEIGTKITFTPGLTNVQDALVAEKGWRDIDFEYDSNNGVYTLTRNADGSITINIIGECEEAIELNASFGNSNDSSFKTNTTVMIKGKAGSGNNPGETPGSDDGDPSDQDGSGSTTNGDTGIKLEAGTKLFDAKLAGSSGNDGGETLFTNDSEGGTEDPSDAEADIESVSVPEDAILEELMKEEIDPQVYELEFDEVPLEETPDEKNPWEVCVFGGALAVVGGLVRGGRFNGALDKAVANSKKKAA